MMTDKKYKIGILAFGSLIDNPGQEIKELETTKIDCVTPFKVEFARISASRSNAPTVIPIKDGTKGKKVKATIIVLDEKTRLDDAKSILWRRECHTKDKTTSFQEPKNPTSRNVLIGELNNFYNVEKVIYTYFIIQEEYKNLTPEKLADYSINSILSKAGKKEKDGVRYLLSIKNSGIETEYSKEYERFILKKTNTNSLSETIEKLDRKRKMYPEK